MSPEHAGDLAARTIRAQRFELVDGEGKVRALLAMDADGPRLALLDAAGLGYSPRPTHPLPGGPRVRQERRPKMNLWKSAVYLVACILVLLGGSAVPAAEEHSGTQLQADLNLLKREVARLHKEVADLRQALAEVRAALAKAGLAETPQAGPAQPDAAPAPQPPTLSRAPAPGSLAALLGRIPAKFMPPGTEATEAQRLALNDWVNENLHGEKVRVRIKIDSIAADSLHGEAVGPFAIHGRQASVKVSARFEKAQLESLLPLAKGMTVELAGTVPEHERQPGRPSRGLGSPHAPLGPCWKGEINGWDGKAAAFSLAVWDCSLVSGRPAAAP
ncbi:MAG: hypothetical protein NTU94_10655 [Planctomycetota bacterium]|nr:hypothetical protein [Planctomycetota bacterium]